MHMQGTPRTMQQRAVVHRRRTRGRRRSPWSRRRRDRRRRARRGRSSSTPASGSARPLEHNLALLRALPELARDRRRAAGRRRVPQVVPRHAARRLPVDERDEATLAIDGVVLPRTVPRWSACTTSPVLGRARPTLARRGIERRRHRRQVVDRTASGSMSTAGLRGRWAQGLQPRYFTWVIKDRLGAGERPGGFAAQPPQGATPGRADLAQRSTASRTSSRCSTRRTTCTPTRKPASPTCTFRSVRTTSWPVRLARSTRRSASFLDDPAEKLTCTTRSSATVVLGVVGGYLLYAGLVDERPARDLDHREAHRAQPRIGRTRDHRRDDRREALPLRSAEDASCPIASSSPASASSVCTACLPEEQTRPQPFQVDLELLVDLAAAGASDDLDDTVDYGAVCERCAASSRPSSYRLLERLAARIAEVCRSDRARARRRGRGAQAPPAGPRDASTTSACASNVDARATSRSVRTSATGSRYLQARGRRARATPRTSRRRGLARSTRPSRSAARRRTTTSTPSSRSRPISTRGSCSTSRHALRGARPKGARRAIGAAHARRRRAARSTTSRWTTRPDRSAPPHVGARIRARAAPRRRARPRRQTVRRPQIRAGRPSRIGSIGTPAGPVTGGVPRTRVGTHGSRRAVATSR